MSEHRKRRGRSHKHNAIKWDRKDAHRTRAPERRATALEILDGEIEHRDVFDDRTGRHDYAAYALWHAVEARTRNHKRPTRRMLKRHVAAHRMSEAMLRYASGGDWILRSRPLRKVRVTFTPKK